MGGRGATLRRREFSRSEGSIERSAEVDFLAKKIAGAGGSNDGGIYEGSDGVQRYVKFYGDETQAYGEALANAIYRDLGIDAPNSQVIEVNGKKAFASDIVAGDQLKNGAISKDIASKILDGFAADVLLSNRDVIGLTNDNIKISGSKVIRIDNGSSFLHRAMGSKKAEGDLDKITEFSGFFNKNKEYQRVAKGAGVKNAFELGTKLNSQVSKISKLRDSAGSWDKYVSNKLPNWKGADRDRIVKMLDARTSALVNKIKTRK